MRRCCVGPCQRPASLRVEFTTGGSGLYCRWHALGRDHTPRWRSEHVARVERLAPTAAPAAHSGTDEWF